MARPRTAARVAAFHAGAFDTIGFLTAWSSCLHQSLSAPRFVDPLGRRSLPQRKNSLKALLPCAPETVPPQPAPAEPETTKKLEGDSHPTPAVPGPSFVTPRFLRKLRHAQSPARRFALGDLCRRQP